MFNDEGKSEGILPEQREATRVGMQKRPAKLGHGGESTKAREKIFSNLSC